uniref:Uncharacterized protein n=1 Tax=Tetraodon nigroviridis TaxID=99883 RepID=H3CL34_TETNG
SHLLCSRTPKKDFVEVTELTDVTYISNLVKLKPGHINVVLVLTNASKTALLKKFAKEVFSFSGSHFLHFSFQNTDKHHHWMPSLLRLTSDMSQSTDHSDDESCLDFSGHVLALNGYKKYLCFFKPVFTGDDPDSSSEPFFKSKRKCQSRSCSSFHSRSRSHSREDGAISKKSNRAMSIEVHHKLDRLGLWMERLMEGTLPRLWVPVWPPLDETTNNS